MKNYRESKQGLNYKTVSLKFNKDTYQRLEKAVSHSSLKNMSHYIEETLSSEKPEDLTSERRKYGTIPVKKTFTFTEDFFNKIKQSGNMSLYVENAIQKYI